MRFALSFLFCIGGLCNHAWSADDEPAPAGLVAEPQQRDSYDWLARHAAVKAYNAEHQPEYALIGDSITHYWGGEPSLGGQNRAPEAWASVFGRHSVVNMGFGFDYIDNAYYRIQDGELAGHSPRVILVLLGTNNLGHRKDSPQDCAAHMKAFLSLLQKTAPQSKILLLGVLPRREKELAGPIAETNRLYQLLADDEKVFYLDLSPVFGIAGGTEAGRAGAASGRPDYLMDAVHPNRAGYEAIAPAIRKALEYIDPQF